MVTREDLVEQSVMERAKTALLTERGYPAAKLDFRDEFPQELLDNTAEGREALTKQIIAVGFNFDDQGTQAEMGSDLLQRIYTIEFFVIGTTNTWARNLAQALKFGLQQNGTIPLLNVENNNVEIDRLEVVGATADRQMVNQPEPWQRFIWLTQVKVLDVYHASLV